MGEAADVRRDDATGAPSDLKGRAAAAWMEYERSLNSVSRSWEARQRKYEMDYQQILAQDLYAKPWGAKVNSQLPHTQVMTLVDHMLAALLPTWPWFSAEVMEPPVELNLSRGSLEAWATQELNAVLRENHFYRLLRRWLRMSAVKGVGVVRMSAGPSLSLVDPANIAWDPQATSLRLDAKWVIEEMVVTVGELQALAAEDDRWDREAIRKAAKAEVEASGGTSREKAMRKRIPGYDDNSGEGDEQPLTIRDYVTPDRIITVHPGSQQVLCERGNGLGYIYYYDMSLYPEVFEVQGFSIPDLMRDLYDEICTTKRQRIDVNSLTAHPILKVTRSSQLDTFQFQARPGAIIPVNTPDDVNYLQPPPLLGQALAQEEAQLVAEADRVTGVMAQTRGERGEQMKATVAQILHSNINVRFSAMVNDVSDYPFRPLLRDFVDLCAERTRPIEVTEAEWGLVSEMARGGMVKLVSHPEAHVGNAFAKMQVLQNVFALVAQHLDPVGQGEFLKVILDLAQLRDPERIASHMLPPEMNPNTAQAIQAQQQAMAVGPVENVAPTRPLTEELARAPVAGQAPMRRAAAV